MCEFDDRLTEAERLNDSGYSKRGVIDELIRALKALHQEVHDMGDSIPTVAQPIHVEPVVFALTPEQAWEKVQLMASTLAELVMRSQHTYFREEFHPAGLPPQRAMLIQISLVSLEHRKETEFANGESIWGRFPSADDE